MTSFKQRVSEGGAVALLYLSMPESKKKDKNTPSIIHTHTLTGTVLAIRKCAGASLPVVKSRKQARDRGIMIDDMHGRRRTASSLLDLNHLFTTNAHSANQPCRGVPAPRHHHDHRYTLKKTPRPSFPPPPKKAAAAAALDLKSDHGG
jgi:regulator of extracellular matrix RemA (YlzA/DUF370 family)